MGLVSANRLNRFWQKGVKPINNAIGVLETLSTVDKTTLVAAINELATGKFDVSKIVASTNITEPGFAMDGKTASEAFAELYSNLVITTMTCRIATVANTTVGITNETIISGQVPPNSNAIPVITTQSSTTSYNAFVRWDRTWYVYSNVSQNIGITFYVIQ